MREWTNTQLCFEESHIGFPTEITWTNPDDNSDLRNLRIFDITIENLNPLENLRGIATVVFRIGYETIAYTRDKQPIHEEISRQLSGEIHRRLASIPGVVVAEKDIHGRLWKGWTDDKDCEFACRNGESLSKAEMRVFKGILNAFGIHAIHSIDAQLTQTNYVRYRRKWMERVEYMLIQEGLVEFEKVTAAFGEEDES
jgi:hypothetical protein